MPEALPSGFQAAGQGKLLFPVEQGNRAHLTQVQPQGVVRSTVAILVTGLGLKIIIQIGVLVLVAKIGIGRIVVNDVVEEILTTVLIFLQVRSIHEVERRAALALGGDPFGL